MLHVLLITGIHVSVRSQEDIEISFDADPSCSVRDQESIALSYSDAVYRSFSFDAGIEGKTVVQEASFFLDP